MSFVTRAYGSRGSFALPTPAILMHGSTAALVPCLLQCAGSLSLAVALGLSAFAQSPASSGVAAARESGDSEVGERVRPLVEQVMASGFSPGLQVAVVLADGRRWAGGFGVADLETGRTVDVETRFYLASTTKALTALAATRLHMRGELDLDTPLSEILPDVAFPTCASPQQISLRDLLTHTHGLRHRGLSWRVAFTGQYTNEQFLDGLVDCECLPERSFRYSNFGYDIAGVVLGGERTHGWKRVVVREVLEPLGMDHTTAEPSSLPADSLAQPHEYSTGGIERIPLTKGDTNMGPAGGHFSTASDLALLVEAALSSGRVGGEQRLPSEVMEEVLRPQVPQERTFQHYRRHHWGLGWDIGTFDGRTVLHRPGGFAGYYSNIALFPDEGFGLAVLANGGGLSSMVAENVAAAIYDEFLGVENRPARIEARLTDLRRMAGGIQERAASRSAPPPVTDAPSRPWEDYAGTYVHADWGAIEVSSEDGGLRMRMGPMQSPLRPLADEADAFHTRLFGEDDVAAFRVDGDGPAVLRFRSQPEEYLRR